MKPVSGASRGRRDLRTLGPPGWAVVDSLAVSVSASLPIPFSLPVISGNWETPFHLASGFVQKMWKTQNETSGPH